MFKLGSIRSLRTSVCLQTRAFSSNSHLGHTAPHPLTTPITEKREPNIMYFCSEVSAITGHNHYVSYSGTFDKVYKRCYLPQFEEYRMAAKGYYRRDVLTNAEFVEQEMQRTGAQTILDEVIEKSISGELSSKELKSETDKMMKTLERNLETQTQETQQIVKDQASHAVNQAYGTRAEPKAVEDYKKQRHVQIEASPIFYKRELGIVDSGRHWYLGGRVDGFADGKLVEIKNRTHKFFDPIPAYDMVQFQCYLAVLDLDDGEFVQRLKYAADPTLTSMIIKRDRLFFDEQIYPKLKQCSEALDMLSSNKDLSIEYLGLEQEKHKDEFIVKNILPLVK